MIAVVDYGMGNIGSIANMIKKAGGKAAVSTDPKDLDRAAKIVLPGVGAFDNGVRNLQQRGFWDALTRRVLHDHVPILGVCLGMQLFTRSSEEGVLSGLGWLNASTVRFRLGNEGPLKVPHMGWNHIVARKRSRLFDEMDSEAKFYFVHSFHVVCDDPADVMAVASYGYEFPACIERDNVYATQFHPEKSHKHGLRLIRNFIERA